jgi:hypothetical protein
MSNGTVQYIQIQAISDLFSPVTRAFGNIAIIGATSATGASTTPVSFTNPGDASSRFPGALGNSIATAFKQRPGPALVYGIPSAGPDYTDALGAASQLDAQLVVLANTLLTDAAVAPPNPTGTPPTNVAGAIVQLAQHVNSVSQTGGDGKERMGVVMFPPGLPKFSLISSDLLSDRMVYIAHKSSKDDVAAAIAGTIAGYEPNVSLLLKPVVVDNDGGAFTPTEIGQINDQETSKGVGVNWLTTSPLIPGGGFYMGEAYTGTKANNRGYIDIVRTIDDISFRLKARLIRSIGNVRISRAGLRSLIAQMEAVLDPLVLDEVITGYQVVVPLLSILDKDPATLTRPESDEKTNAEASRLVKIAIAVEYAAAVHRLAINLRFT